MFARLCSLLVVLGGVGTGAAASGQEVIYYRPIAEPIFVAPPAVTYYGPVVVQRPAVVTRAPVTVYRPVVPEAAVTVYSPIESAPAVVPASPVLVTGRPVIVRPKVYVRGQPIRNVLRAITP